MKSYAATGADPANPEKFLAYMAPAPGEVDGPLYIRLYPHFSFVILHSK